MGAQHDFVQGQPWPQAFRARWTRIEGAEARGAREVACNAGFAPLGMRGTSGSLPGHVSWRTRGVIYSEP